RRRKPEIGDIPQNSEERPPMAGSGPGRISPDSHFSAEDETRPPSGKERIMILGGGPNRIGQGIEFDYCCVQAAFALRDAGFETIMVNSNPETVSTDYDTSDHLFFEPLTVEDVLNICDRMIPAGVIVQFGWRRPWVRPVCRSSAPASRASTRRRTASCSSG